MMHRKLTLGLFATLALACGAIARGEPTTQPAEGMAAKAPGTVDPKAKAVLDRYIEVTGGRAAYEKVKSRETKGTLEFVAQGIKGSVASKQTEGKILVKTDIAGIGAIEQAYNGEVGWTRNPMEGLRLLNEKELAQVKMEASGDDSLLHPEMTYSAIRHAGEEQVDGKPADKIEMDGPTGKVTSLYDKETGYLVETHMTVASPQGDQAVTSTMSDYRDEGGIKVPHLTMQTAGPLQIKLTVESVTVNPAFPEDTFKAPEDVKALQKK